MQIFKSESYWNLTIAINRQNLLLVKEVVAANVKVYFRFIICFITSFIVL